MSQISRICVLGSVNLDFVIQTRTLPRAGETVGEGVFSALPGGKGSNVALAARRLGANVDLLACVGDDIHAGAALFLLKEAAVNIEGVASVPDAPTGVAFINVAESGENQIAVASGANMVFTGVGDVPVTAGALITQFEIPLNEIKTRIAEFDGFTCLNASPVGPDLSELLPHTNMVIVNSGEYAFYESALSEYDGYVAITLGGDGAKLLHKRQDIARAFPPKVDVVDTTGAGDSFAAALTLAFVEKQTPQSALEFACTVGALVTTKIGTQPAMPMRVDVDARLAPRD